MTCMDTRTLNPIFLRTFWCDNKEADDKELACMSTPWQTCQETFELQSLSYLDSIWLKPVKIYKMLDHNPLSFTSVEFPVVFKLSMEGTRQVF